MVEDSFKLSRIESSEIAKKLEACQGKNGKATGI
jgi:hypothetical protein